MLAARHANGAPDAIRLALSGEEPGQIARRLHYLMHVSRAAAEVVASVKQGIAELAKLRHDALAKASRLAEVESAQRADRKKLLAERRERRRILERLAREIRDSRQQIKVLRADESRLARLVTEIAAVLAATPHAGADRVENVADSVSIAGPFSTLRGKLRLPVRGELARRFGTRTQSGGLDAKGVFIQAAGGERVRAIAAGQVVFADWMRGFGNLLIIDHGEAYLSIYANNEALLRQVGDPVVSGDPVAIVGASGGNEQTGLYFELRHLGRPFDPLLWVSSR